MKSLMVDCAGYLLSLGGIGPSSCFPRFNYGTVTLHGGGGEVISLVIGIFAISEVLVGLEESRPAVAFKNIGSVYPGLRCQPPGDDAGDRPGFLPGFAAGSVRSRHDLHGL